MPEKEEDKRQRPFECFRQK
jgi:hypothetical protein